jgi:hypothetical protein
MSKGKHYTREFKESSAKLAIDSDQTIAQTVADGPKGLKNFITVYSLNSLSRLIIILLHVHGS